ncbi:hypothetical protein IPF37_02840 [bacterium]|nr:MAG: hypothetical protein IPF37_02840 [bacterium]
MKKIIFLAVGVFLFSSIQARVHSDVEIAQALLQNNEFVATCCVLSKAGLTHDQIVAQLMQSDKKVAYGRLDYLEFDAEVQEFSLIQSFVCGLSVAVAILFGIGVMACGRTTLDNIDESCFQ